MLMETTQLDLEIASVSGPLAQKNVTVYVGRRDWLYNAERKKLDQGPRLFYWTMDRLSLISFRQKHKSTS